MKARLGTVCSDKVRTSRGAPVISWNWCRGIWSRAGKPEIWWICNAECVGVGISFGGCSGSDGGRSDRKSERCGAGGWCGKKHWTSHPKVEDSSMVADGLAVVWEEVLEFLGSTVCLDGNTRHAISHRTARANKCLAKWRTVLSSSWIPRKLRLALFP